MILDDLIRKELLTDNELDYFKLLIQTSAFMSEFDRFFEKIRNKPKIIAKLIKKMTTPIISCELR